MVFECGAPWVGGAGVTVMTINHYHVRVLMLLTQVVNAYKDLIIHILILNYGLATISN